MALFVVEATVVAGSFAEAVVVSCCGVSSDTWDVSCVGPAKSVILSDWDGARLASFSLGNESTTDLDVSAVDSSVSASVRSNISVTTCERLESSDEVKVGDDDENVGFTETDDVASPGYMVGVGKSNTEVVGFTYKEDNWEDADEEKVSDDDEGWNKVKDDTKSADEVDLFHREIQLPGQLCKSSKHHKYRAFPSVITTRMLQSNTGKCQK